MSEVLPRKADDGLKVSSELGRAVSQPPKPQYLQKKKEPFVSSRIVQINFNSFKR
jgi:hypothetical protein